MTAVLIVAHAPLASALLSVAAHVHGGVPPGLGALDVPADADLTQLLPDARAQLQALSGGGDALLLTDLAGATPANLAQRLLGQPQAGQRLRLLAGINAPMLLRALSYRDRGLDELAELAASGAHRCMVELPPTPDDAGAP